MQPIVDQWKRGGDRALFIAQMGAIALEATHRTCIEVGQENDLEQAITPAVGTVLDELREAGEIGGPEGDECVALMTAIAHERISEALTK